MDATPVAIDLANEVFEFTFADTHGRIIERKLLLSATLFRTGRHFAAWL